MDRKQRINEKLRSLTSEQSRQLAAALNSVYMDRDEEPIRSEKEPDVEAEDRCDVG